jgi:hypothetical protein
VIGIANEFKVKCANDNASLVTMLIINQFIIFGGTVFLIVQDSKRKESGFIGHQSHFNLLFKKIGRNMNHQIQLKKIGWAINKKNWDTNFLQL